MNVLKQRPYPRSQPQRQANQRQMSQRPNMNRNGSNGGQRPGQKRPDSRIYKPHKQYAGTIDTLKKVIATCFTYESPFKCFKRPFRTFRVAEEQNVEHNISQKAV